MPSGSEVELSESWGACMPSGPEVEVSESCTCMGEREGLVVEEWEGLIVTGDSGTSGRLGKASSELVDVRTASSPCCSSSRCLSRSVTGPSSVSRYPSKSSSLSPSSGRSRMYSSKNSGLEGNLWAMCAYEKKSEGERLQLADCTARLCGAEFHLCPLEGARARCAIAPAPAKELRHRIYARILREFFNSDVVLKPDKALGYASCLISFSTTSSFKKSRSILATVP